MAEYKLDAVKFKNLLATSSILFFIFWVVSIKRNNFLFNKVYTNINAILLGFLGAFFIIYISVLMCSNSSGLKRNIAELGKDSFHIYLLHRIFTHGIIIILSKLRIYNIYINMIIAFILGLLIPIFIYKFIKRYLPQLNVIFYPSISLKRNAK